MKATLFLLAISASVNGAVIEQRQGGRQSDRPGRPTGVPGNPGGGDVRSCGLDAFIGHTSEASLFCSSILRSGTATLTATSTARGETTTVQTTVYTTLFPPSVVPSSTPLPPTSTPRPPTSTPAPPTSTPIPPTSTPKPSTTVIASSSAIISSPAPSATVGCGIVGYTGATAAYYFDSTGTKNTWAACSAACKADSKCKSFGYGEANCMLFDVSAESNSNYNPMSPYTFYDVYCPVELPVRKRQVNISLALPSGPSSACQCLITSGPADTTKTTTVVVTSGRATKTETVTKTLSLLPGRAQSIQN